MGWLVPQVNIQRDCRFSLEDQWWLSVVPAIEEAAQRGIEITPLTVFCPETGSIYGWFLHGWQIKGHETKNKCV
jgi:hypothetical protein